MISDSTSITQNAFIKLILSNTSTTFTPATPGSPELLQVIDNNLDVFTTHDELVTYALNYIRKRLPETTVFTTYINTNVDY